MKDFLIRCLFILVISINLFNTLLCSLITIPYHFHYTTHKTEIFTEDPSLSYHVMIDLTSQYTWINSIKDSPSSDVNANANENAITNRHLKESQLVYNHKEMKGKETQGSFGFKNYFSLLNEFNYFFLTERNSNDLPRADGVLGLAYSFTDEKYSLVHQLKNKGLIDHLSFSIVNRNQIYFGGIPIESITNLYHSACDVINEANSIIEGHWTCLLSKVIIKAKGKSLTYRIKKKEERAVTFITESEKNYAPKSFISFIKNKFYSEQLRSNYFHINNRNGIEQIYSPDDGTVHHGNITFVIGNYSFSVQMEDFWECYDVACDFTLYENPYGDYWMLGVSFYKMYQVMFDYEGKTVNFYSRNEVLLYDDSKDIDQIKAMLIFNGVILSIGLFWMFWRKRK